MNFKFKQGSSGSFIKINNKKVKEIQYATDNMIKRKIYLFQIIGNDYNHNLSFDHTKKHRDINNTYDLMQLNRSQFIESMDKENTVYLDTDFDHYPMGTKPLLSNTLNKTHDGRRSRDNLKLKEKNRLMQFRQNSSKDLSRTLKRVRSKRLTQRGHQRFNDLNSSVESYKYFSNMNATKDKFMPNSSLEYVSPKKQIRKEEESKSLNKYVKYVPIDMNTSQDTQLIDSKFTKSYGPSRSKVAPGIKAALQELKMQSKKNNSSSRGRKKVVKLNPASRIPHQATVCNSNTSRKTPVHNSKFGNVKHRQSKQSLNKEFKKLNPIKPQNIRKVNFNGPPPKIFDPQATHNILKMIKGMHKNVPRPGVHYRARTTEIGSSKYVKGQPSKRVSCQNCYVV